MSVLLIPPTILQSCQQHSSYVSSVHFVQAEGESNFQFCLMIAAYNTINFTTGEADDLLSLDELVTVLAKDLDKCKVELIVEEEYVAELFKSMSKIVSEYEAKTREMVELLRKARDE